MSTVADFVYDKRARRITAGDVSIELLCRDLVAVGIRWLTAHPESSPAFEATSYIGCGRSPRNDATREFERAVAHDVPSIPDRALLIDGALTHAMYAHEHGWDAYQLELCGGPTASEGAKCRPTKT